jgi:UDP-N-acetylmuramoyl-L-alanyl-D-glutamate--2,6-diaminopimelate ligase
MARAGETLTRLATLVGGMVVGTDDPHVTDVTHDSRSVVPGSLYVAIRGAAADGHDFVTAAIEAGAAAVCVDHGMGIASPQLIVDDTRAVLGALADAVHGSPSAHVKVIGVTGTNGKTTVTHYIESIAAGAGLTVGLVGTIQTRVGGVGVPSVRTTPEASDFQRLLAQMRDHGADLVAAEVSSHALEYGRVLATRFAVAAFTNLSQDHLDFHGDMASYRASKTRLFTEYELAMAVVNIDDPVGADLASGYRGEILTVGVDGHVSATDIVSDRMGSRFRLATPWGSADVDAPVLGEFNVSNLVVAATCCLAVGMGFDDVVSGMGHVAGVPGRFEVVSGDDPVTVVVDYAHTPEGVAKAVDTGRGLTDGRVIALVGAGGDRDRDKRPAMGAAISRADLAIITSDNPRSEEPASIVEAVAGGIDLRADRLIEVDRRRAIELALQQACPGDLVLILGRGHEPMQEAGGERIPFDDRSVAHDALTRLRRSSESDRQSGSMST